MELSYMELTKTLNSFLLSGSSRNLVIEDYHQNDLIDHCRLTLMSRSVNTYLFHIKCTARSAQLMSRSSPHHTLLQTQPHVSSRLLQDQQDSYQCLCIVIE